MCFTVNVNLIKEELENRYGATLIDHDKYRPSYYYNAFALPLLPAVCSEDPSLIQMLQWGLIPSQTKDISQAENIRVKTFNARSDSLDTKSSFASAFRSNRCIIPVSGFYEWQHTSDRKIPWYIYPAGDKVFSLAGIYDRWTETSTGEIYSTFSIVTTEANELMAEIHNSAKRMPVILNKEAEKRWIDISVPEREALDLLVPCPSDLLKAHTIGQLVNNRNAERNDPEVIRPYSYFQQGNLLF